MIVLPKSWCNKTMLGALAIKRNGQSGQYKIFIGYEALHLKRLHLWVGERFVKIVLDEIVGVVAPEMSPLPLEWSGPMERWSDI